LDVHQQDAWAAAQETLGRSLVLPTLFLLVKMESKLFTAVAQSPNDTNKHFMQSELWHPSCSFMEACNGSRPLKLDFDEAKRMRDSSEMHLRVIVADDDEDMRRYYARILPQMGHEVASFESNGLDLVTHALERLPHLVITDVKMPGMDGLRAVERIGEFVPCIVVSAVDRPKGWPPHSSIKFVDYLVKPIVASDLRNSIAKACALIQGESGEPDIV
jgi:CheY-like chemotaxis protein